MTTPAPPLLAVPAPADDEHTQRLRRIYTAILVSALLSYASFHPLNLGGLAWVAVVPLLFLGARETPWVAAGIAYFATVLYHVGGLSWIAMVTPEGWLITSFLEGFYGIALICVPLWLRKRTGLPLMATLGAWGALLECIRANFPFVGFPWLLWGHSQHERDLLIQIADLGSVYGLTFLVLTVNAAIADVALLVRARLDDELDLSPADQRRIAALAGTPLALIVLALGYGGFRRAQVEAEMAKDPGPRLLVIQVDLPQSLKDSSKRTTIFQLAQMNLGMSEAAVRWNAGRPVDAMLWSETMWPWPLPDRRSAGASNGWDAWYEERQRRHGQAYVAALSSYMRRLLDLPTRLNAPLYVGAVDFGLGGTREHNSYYAIAPDPPRQGKIVNRYDKTMLVPVSEYIPFEGSPSMGWFFRFMKSLVPKGFIVFERGKAITTPEQLFTAGKYKLAPNICFEISFPELLRQATLAGADAHVCPANDAWFVRGFPPEPAVATAEVPLARAHSKFRAIETRRPVIRCVNRGVSLAIDPTGKQVAQIEKLVEGKQDPVNVGVANYMAVQAPTTKLMSLYVRVGNLFPILCGLVMAVLIVLGFKRKTLLAPTEGTQPPTLVPPPELVAGGMPGVKLERDASEPEAKSEPDSKPESEPESKAEPEPGSKPEPDEKPEPESKAEPEPDSKPEPDAKPESEPESKAEPEPEPESKPDAPAGDES